MTSREKGQVETLDCCGDTQLVTEGEDAGGAGLARPGLPQTEGGEILSPPSPLLGGLRTFSSMALEGVCSGLSAVSPDPDAEALTPGVMR